MSLWGTTPINTTKTSPQFNCADADIIFVSSDPSPVRFHIHADNLRTSSGSFPPVPPKSSEKALGGLIVDEPVPLSEPAAVLELLFAFIYPKRHPDLEGLKFDEVLKLSEAAEKYEVFSAMNVCRRRMRDFASSNPLEVCLYGARHDYLDVVKETAEAAALLPLPRVVRLLPPRMFLPWVEYRAKWDKVLDFLMDFSADQHKVIGKETSTSGSYQARHCYDNWSPFCATIVHKARNKVSINPFLDMDNLFPNNPPINNYCCREAYGKWKLAVSKEVKKVPPFAQFIVEQMHV
ncbi:hypothetical protein BKA70DRAFT_1149303 [Coprinopsis sp. MPI-PUGE-AT-0042]|nr:hypothetical protein BKA70DRAFT_1149303 [Coprinopsis sp. MPI-PUGE-AT-0042]